MAPDAESQMPVRQPGRWPWQRSLQSRIVFSYGLIFLTILGLLTIVIGQIIYGTNQMAAEHGLEVAAFLASNALEDPLSGYALEFETFRQYESERDKQEREEPEDNHEKGEDDERSPQQSPTPASIPTAIVLPRLQQVATIYASDSNAQVTILDPLGNVVADSSYPTHAIPNQASQAEIRGALSGQDLLAIRPHDITGQSTLYAAAPIQQGSEILGIVQMSRPMFDVTADARRLVMSVAAAAGLALLLAIGLAVWIGRRLVRPVRELEGAALATASGDFTVRVKAGGDDELAALARAFNHMVDAVHEMIERQRLFVANASHELRTPLTNIKLRSEAIRSLGAEEPELTDRYLVEIDSEADRLIRLANDLLDLARMESRPRLEPPPEPVDVLPTLREAAEMMNLRAEEAAVSLSLDLPETLPKLRVHVEYLEAVVVNLLDNAIKYTPTQGRVEMSAVVEPARVQIRVQDTGAGIPADELPYIFERFYRVDKARSRQNAQRGLGSGAGLGLSIARFLVEQDQGAIEVDSTPTSGTVFVLSYPRVA